MGQGARGGELGRGYGLGARGRRLGLCRMGVPWWRSCPGRLWWKLRPLQPIPLITSTATTSLPPLLLQVLGSNITLQRLDCSWNTLRAESGRVLEVALAGNAGLRELGLAHNGLADVDGARVLKGLLSHGAWEGSGEGVGVGWRVGVGWGWGGGGRGG